MSDIGENKKGFLYEKCKLYFKIEVLYFILFIQKFLIYFKLTKNLSLYIKNLLRFFCFYCVANCKKNY